MSLIMLGATFVPAMLAFLIITLLKTRVRLSRPKLQSIISNITCLSGGVFMAALLLDLLPDLKEIFDTVEHRIKDEFQIEINFPLSELFLGLGFLLTLSIEQTLLHFKTKWAAETEREREALLSESRTPSYQDITSLPSTQRSSSDETEHDNEGHSHLPCLPASSLRSLLLLIALSFHSLFEGIAIGLQNEANPRFSFILAVNVHKAIMAFSLGFNIARSNSTMKSFFKSIALFCCSSPFGILIGMLVLDLPHNLTRDILSSVLQAIAGGTVLYITVFEVLQHELDEKAKGNRLWKVLFIILGFVGISGFILATSEGDEKSSPVQPQIEHLDLLPNLRT